ncbi:hypothetical protein [Raineyella sp.]|uniref:hypothetical protein n=1 Tax=Raineyella sp. TaxID=1911550 RepID=UPI002B1EA987|nr:hypothetical protein [Raineyella sp.]MEA5155581.1 hypothetical protein [Raineyella sp.]
MTTPTEETPTMTDPETTIDERLTSVHGRSAAARDATRWPAHKAKARAQRAQRARHGRAPRARKTTR